MRLNISIKLFLDLERFSREYLSVLPYLVFVSHGHCLLTAATNSLVTKPSLT
jgi:hypothetical protein